eukprot:7204390-Alexandrium_andersonii.AAC.1
MVVNQAPFDEELGPEDSGAGKRRGVPPSQSGTRARERAAPFEPPPPPPSSFKPTAQRRPRSTAGASSRASAEMVADMLLDHRRGTPLTDVEMDMIATLTVPELRKVCDLTSYSTTGTKDQLIDKLVDGFTLICRHDETRWGGNASMTWLQCSQCHLMLERHRRGAEAQARRSDKAADARRAPQGSSRSQSRYEPPPSPEPPAGPQPQPEPRRAQRQAKQEPR